MLVQKWPFSKKCDFLKNTFEFTKRKLQELKKCGHVVPFNKKWKTIVSPYWTFHFFFIFRPTWRKFQQGSLGLSQHNIKTTKSDFCDFWGQHLLLFAYLWPIFASSDQDKHLNRSKHTLADQFPSYITLRESLGMSQHNINVPELAFWNLGDQISAIFCLLLTKFWSLKPT